MPRISGIDIPEGKRIEVALTYLYGIGRNNAAKVLKAAKVEVAKKTGNLTEEEISRIQKVIDEKFLIEGDLRKRFE